MEPLTEPDDLDFAKAIEDSGLAVTGIRNGKEFLCGGVHPIDDVAGEAWLRLSEDCMDHKIGTMRLIHDGLKIIEEVYPFKQLIVSINDCYKVGARMVKRLGFEFVEEKTFEGKNWLIYSKET